MSVSDTIFALATPPGQSAIAIIRISGIGAHDVLSHFGVTGMQVLDKPSAQYRRLRADSGQIIDDVMLVLFPSSASPTGENITEIQCHGSPAVVQFLLSELADIPGLRPAQPGEFSRRSFNNGKMGLVDLEGLADLIDAQTTLQHQQAMNVMTGKLSNQLLIYREQLVSISSRLETIIDFSDEDLPNDVLDGYVNTIKELQNNINLLVSDSELSEQIRDGVKIALIGPVNAGKSTILNVLAKREVAIVSEIEGTTRDVIEVRLDLGGIPVILTDTAGIREAEDFVEIEGIRRAKKVAAESDVTILVLDVSNPDWAEMIGEFEKWGSAIKLVVLNKADLVTDNAIQQQINHANTPILEHAEPIIASFQNQNTENSGDILVKKLAEILSYIPTSSSDLRLTRSWHKSACLSVSAALERSMALDIQQQPELVAEELRYACVSLGRLTGTVDAEDLLDNIFSNFCIGK